tara:strand:- start:2805 stop:3800 length:996 start_codon:yes stop_codon:yes gene_type:complete
MAKRKYSHKKYSRKKYSRKKYSRKKTKNYSRKKYHKKRKYSKRRKYQRGGSFKKIRSAAEGAVRSGVRNLKRMTPKRLISAKDRMTNMAESAAAAAGSKSFLERRELKNMKEEFQNMEPEELKMRAKAVGIGEDEIERAMKSGDGNSEMVELIFKNLPEDLMGAKDELDSLETVFRTDAAAEELGNQGVLNQMKKYVNHEESFGIYGDFNNIDGTPEEKDNILFSEKGFELWIDSEFCDPADRKNYRQNEDQELHQRVLRYLPLWKSLKGHQRPFITIPDYCFVNNQRGYPVFRDEFVEFVKGGLSIEQATDELKKLDENPELYDNSDIEI